VSRDICVDPNEAKAQFQVALLCFFLLTKLGEALRLRSSWLASWGLGLASYGQKQN